MKKGLGRGFDSLIPTNLLDETFDPTAKQDEKMSRLVDIPVEDIIPDPNQPRQSFDEGALDELAASLKEHGLVQPIVVAPKGKQYLIVAGERRWRAAQKAGLTEMSCIVRTMNDQHRLEVSLIENLQRRDLNALETATAYLKLRDQFNLTLEEIGKRVGGLSISGVSNKLRLLKLPKALKEAIYEGQLSEGQARPLIGLPEDVAEKMMKQAIKEEWSARRVEQAVTLWRQAEQTPEKSKKIEYTPHADTLARLTKRFDTNIKIRTNAKGAGRISIAFKNDQEFERISKLLEK